MLEILQISTTANSKGIFISHSGTPITGTGYGLYSEITGASTTNIAGHFIATGASNNYALIVPASSGIVGIGTITPTSTALVTINPTTNTIRNGIDMSFPGSGTISSTAYGVNIAVTTNQNVRGFLYTNSTAGAGPFYGVGTQLTAGTTSEGYLSYRSGSPKTYAVYGVGGDYAGYFTNKVSVTSNTSPDGVADLEVQNTTSGAGNPATLSLRQTTTSYTTGNVLSNLNFGSSTTTNPQAQIQIVRGAAGGATDLPTDILFYTTPDASTTMAERMRILYNGNIGIGTSIPQRPVEIASGQLRFSNVLGDIEFTEVADFTGRVTTASPAATDAVMRVFTSSAGTELMRIQHDGKVGIGTTLPSRKLEVYGDIRATNNTWSGIEAQSYGAGLHGYFMGMRGRGTIAAPAYPLYQDALAAFLGRDAIDAFAVNYGGGGMYVWASENFSAANKGTYVTLNTTQNGTNIPATERFLITDRGDAYAYKSMFVDGLGQNNGAFNNGADDGSALIFAQGSGEGIASDRNGGGGNLFGLDFYTSFQKRMIIKNGGGIEMNTGTSATDALYVRTDPSAMPWQGGIIQHQSSTYAFKQTVQNTSNLNLGTLQFDYVTRTSPGTVQKANVLVLQSNGMVGIGTNTPGEMLEVAGNIWAGGDIYLGALDGNCGTNGWVAANWCSDIRLKKEITPINNSLDKILKMQGVNYFFKVDEFPSKHLYEGKQVGLIAQDVETLVPEVVWTGKDGFQNINYDKLVPVLIEAIKEQQLIIEQLKKENSKKQAEIDEVVSRVSKLEALLGTFSEKK